MAGEESVYESDLVGDENAKGHADQTRDCLTLLGTSDAAMFSLPISRTAA